MFRNKKILVAGGSGFIGTNLIIRLKELGAKVRGTYLSHQPQFIHENVEYIKADLTRREDCIRTVRGMDYVFMCAANTSGAAVMEKTPLVHVTPNVIMNTLMLEAAYEAKVNKYLWISSSTVYPITEYPVREEEAMSGPLFEKYYCVGWMKQFGEILCRMYTEKIPNPMKVVVVRPSNAYGIYDKFDWESSHVIPALIRRVVERHNPINVWGDGKDIKDLIYVEDLVNGMILAMEKLEGFVPINIASGRQCTIRQALRIILEIENYENAEVIFDTSKPTMIPKRMIDNSLAKKILGFEAPTSLEEGLRRTIEWYKNRIKQIPRT